MAVSLLALSGMDLIIPSVTLAVILIAVMLLIIFKAKRKAHRFYSDMERMKDREEKSERVARFLQDCYSGGYHNDGMRICPVCDNRYSVAETVTDENGDESRKTVEKECPRCAVKLYRDRKGGYDIERNVDVKEKYKNHYDLLTKYIDTYGATPKDKTWDHSIFD